MRLTRAEQREATRARLLDAAVLELAERGYHGASVHRIAETAGVTAGAIYGHFDSKAELMLAAVQHVGAGIEQWAPDEAPDLRSLLHRGAHVARSHAAGPAVNARLLLKLQSQIVSLGYVEGEPEEIFRDYVTTILQRLASAIDGAVAREGGRLTRPAAHVALEYWSLLGGFVNATRVAPDLVPPAALDEALDRLAFSACDGSSRS